MRAIIYAENSCRGGYTCYLEKEFTKVYEEYNPKLDKAILWY